MNTEREQYLFENMVRWRKVADVEHAKHCKKRHDCGHAVEEEYDALRMQEWRAANDGS
jgi:hypothetical protein